MCHLRRITILRAKWGLRSYLAVLFILCIYFQWTATTLSKARERWAVIRRLESSGAWVSYVEQPSVAVPRWLVQLTSTNEVPIAVRGIRFSHEAADLLLCDVSVLNDANRLYLGESSVSDESLKAIRSFQQLEVNSLSYTCVTDQGVAELRDLGSLRIVCLNNTLITDEGVQHLAHLGRLEEVNLGDTSITDKSVLELCKHSTLKVVNLHGTEIGDDGLEVLSRHRAITHLYLDGTRVTDEGLRHLGKMHQLKELSLDRTAVTNAGIAHLRNLRSLEYLYMSQTSIGDEGLRHLHGLKRLEAVVARDSRATYAGGVDLRMAVPNIEVAIERTH